MNLTTVIPCFNRRDTIGHAVKSAVEQRLPTGWNHRIIVVDDCSTDESFKTMTDLVFRYPGHLQIYRNEKNLGPSGTRNAGIRIMWEDTDVFGMLDSDDTWNPIRAATCLPCFEDPAVGAVVTDFIIKDFVSNRTQFEYREPFDLERLKQNSICPSSCFVRKSILATVGLYDETMRVSEDWELFIRIGKKSVIKHIAEPLMTYAFHKGNSTFTVPMEKWRDSWQTISERANA